MTRILGIDPGLTRCGVGAVTLLPGRKLQFDHVEVLQSAADSEPQQRLAKIGGAIERILDSAEKPNEIALERVFAQQNLPSVMGVAQISGVVLYLAAQRGIPVTLYTPNEVKLQVTGYGAADKSQVATMVARHLGLAALPKPADAADSLAIAITHAWALSRAGAAALGSKANASGGQTPAQTAWLAAEQKAGRRRKGMRR
ncbi:crossover junction endodeoxyribonuclease RuvC [Canibacter zhoujuaniae]|uniref:crossover junction endodeoxyribonuclease RuvC n=1 Tax=Canibacter zhoujuaniae TaxID=2708343 RepID=UPI001420F1BE|nr:crossover junction endodeoxyribonuclease RuvC [Canibacter zhoujuaniae]